MLFLVVEVMRSLSNLIKSGFVAFSKDDKLVIDANKNKIITGIDTALEEAELHWDEPAIHSESTMEEVLAEALIKDAGLDGDDFAEDELLKMNTSDLTNVLENSSGELQQVADEVVKSAQSEAEMIINHAHDEAEQMRSLAYDEAEQIKAQATEEGYQQGYEEGIRAASEELQEKRMVFEEYVQDKEHALQQKEVEILKETERKMVDFLCLLIPQITGVVIEEHRDVLLYMVNSAMQDLDNSKHFVIRVSSDDYEMIAERKDEIYGALNPNIELEIFEDAKLAPLQCLIETDNGIVDVSLDIQLENLITTLKLMVKE